MVYKNNRTGAVIDSPCVISGGDWEAQGSIKKSDVDSNSDVSGAKPKKTRRAPKKEGN